MIKTVLSSLFAVFLFSLGAIGAWYFVQFQQSQQQDAVQAQAEAAGLLGADGTTDSPNDGVDSGDSAPLGKAASAVGGGQEELPVAVHGRALSAEEIFRYGAVNRKNIAMIRQREERVRREEARLELIKQDIHEQKTEIEGILQQTQQSIDQAQHLLEQLEAERQQLVAEKQKLAEQVAASRQETTLPDADRRANLKEIATKLSGVEATSAAKYLETLYNDGDTELALQLFSEIEPRSSAKILEVLEPTLAAQLIKNYAERPRPALQKKRR